jgi:hypothetical protein
MYMKFIVVISLIVVILISSGCCCLAPNINPQPANNPGYDDPGVADNILIGGWGNLGVSGDLVDAAGNYAGDAYSGEGYRFNRDGTYVYRIIGSGLALSGLAEIRGNYRVSGDTLYLYNNKESWYPLAGDQTPGYKNKPYADETYTFRTEDDDTTLVLIAQGSEYENYLHRTD